MAGHAVIRPPIVEKVNVTVWFERFDVAANVRGMILMSDTALCRNY
jgi:hypothetical protein